MQHDRQKDKAGNKLDEAAKQHEKGGLADLLYTLTISNHGNIQNYDCPLNF